MTNCATFLALLAPLLPPPICVYLPLLSTQKMVKLAIPLYFICALSCLPSLQASSHPSQHSPPLFPLRIQANQTASSCNYVVEITTSCSSVSYTRDQISLSFGDAYGNQVYVERLDDPSSGTFEACSTDTFDIYGPCTYDVCYVYLYRSGYDGWKVSNVRISGSYTRTATFKYSDWIPNDVWYGFNYCSGSSSQGYRPPLSTLIMAIATLLFFMLEWHSI